MIRLYDHQRFLFKYFLSEDESIFLKYSLRWSSVLWNLSISSSSVVYSLKG